MLKNLELRKDSDRIRLMNDSDSPFELTQEDINKCIQKEDSNSLTDILSGMLLKLQNVKKQKTDELNQKKQESTTTHKIIKNSDSLENIRQEAHSQKAKSDEQQRHVQQLAEEIEMNEIQEKITQQTIDNESSKVMQYTLILEKAKKKVAIETNKRYSKLIQQEE